MAGAIGFLFNIIMKQAREQSAMNGRIGKLEGEHEAITELSKKTLEVVHSAIKDTCSECPKNPDNQSE